MSSLHIVFSIYYALQLFSALVISTDLDSPRAKTLIQRWFMTPYKEGILLGDVLAILIWLPAVLSIIVVWGLLPGTADALAWFCNIKLTKPRPRK
jgi:hypothetical protein